VDELSELMRHLRLQTRVFHQSTHCGQWTVDGEYERKAMFHLVAAYCAMTTASAM
jgi:AraC family transcriptional activator of mtrCDE